MKLRFTPLAVENIAELADYIRTRDPRAVERVRADIYASLRNVILFPKVGRRQTAEGVRELVTPKFSYLIYYTVDEAADEIIVLNVKHPAREREHTDI